MSSKSFVTKVELSSILDEKLKPLMLLMDGLKESVNFMSDKI